MQAVSSILQWSDVVNNLGVYLDLELVMERMNRRAKYAKFVTSTYVSCEQCVDRSPGINTHVNPRLQYESDRSLQRSPIWVWFISTTGFSPSWTRLPIWSWFIFKFINMSVAICYKLHWLPIRRRIDFKINLAFRHCMVGAAPKVSVGTDTFCRLSRRSIMSPVGFLWRFHHLASTMWPSRLCCLRPPIRNSPLIFSKFSSSSSSANYSLIYW